VWRRGRMRYAEPCGGSWRVPRGEWIGMPLYPVELALRFQKSLERAMLPGGASKRSR
jgi:hypothetical protein